MSLGKGKRKNLLDKLGTEEGEWRDGNLRKWVGQAGCRRPVGGRIEGRVKKKTSRWGGAFGIREKPSTREASRNPQDFALFLNLSGRPSSEVEWPPEWSLDAQAVREVWNIVTGSPYHPYQFPCANSLLALVLHPPSWLKIHALFLEVRTLLVLLEGLEKPKVLQVLPATLKEMGILPLHSPTLPMGNVRGARVNGSSQRGGQEADYYTWALLFLHMWSNSAYGEVRQALSEAVGLSSILPLREARGSHYRQEEDPSPLFMI